MAAINYVLCLENSPENFVTKGKIYPIIPDVNPTIVLNDKGDLQSIGNIRIIPLQDALEIVECLVNGRDVSTLYLIDLYRGLIK